MLGVISLVETVLSLDWLESINYSLCPSDNPEAELVVYFLKLI
jgi:hypothetical protein